MLSAATWKMAPTQKIATARSKVLRRPNESPVGAASRAPRAVPALRMATMIDESFVQMSMAPLSSMQFVCFPNCSLNSVMARIPLMALQRWIVSICD
jgi:hypothetical protein